MKTTISEFITYLSELPPDTEVSVLRSYVMNYDVCTEEVELDLTPISGNVDFIDLSNDKRSKGTVREGKKYLILGSQE